MVWPPHRIYQKSRVMHKKREEARKMCVEEDGQTFVAVVGDDDNDDASITA
jgi:hypothetical protein